MAQGHMSTYSQLPINPSVLTASLLRQLPAEMAHEFAVGCLSSMPKLLAGLFGCRSLEIPSLFSTTVPGLGMISHPIGLAAGFDKNAVAVPGLASLGFSFIEVGAVTPKAQDGNPKPRLFRITKDRALINRMGFNNDGVEAIRKRLMQDKVRNLAVPIMVNIGKNRDTPPEHALGDYMKVFDDVKDCATACVANLSSPNTPGLRQLANVDFLRSMASCFGSEIKKIWLKLDPDMEKETFQKIVETVSSLNFGGLVLSNTTAVSEPQRGGMSGVPLLGKSNKMLLWAWEVHRGQMPIIGVGGIWSGADAVEKIRLGAHAIQIYTAFVYQGPGVVGKMISEMVAEMNQLGVQSVAELRGTHPMLVKF